MRTSIWNKARRRTRGCRGSAVIFMVVVIGALTTGMVSTMALTGGVGSQVSSMTLHRDQAFYAAEAGIQRGYYEVEYGAWMNPTNNQYPVYNNVAVGNCTYKVWVGPGAAGYNTTLTIYSLGTYSNDSTVQSLITVTFQPKTTIPAI